MLSILKTQAPLTHKFEEQLIHHADRLARAEKRHRQSAKLVQKWKLRIAELDRAGVDAKQTRLWADEHPDAAFEIDIL